MTELDITMMGHLLRELQAGVRTLRGENKLLGQQIAGITESHRRQVAGIAEIIADRIAAFEAHVDIRIDRLDTRLDQTERSIEERLIRIEALLAR